MARRRGETPTSDPDALPVKLLILDGLTPAERSRWLLARREWYAARGLERDWRARHALEAEARCAAGLTDPSRPDPRAALYTDERNHP